MSRYIDADALKERLIQNITLTNAIDKSFSEAPSIDIVFCKECKWGKWCRSNGEFYLWCRPNIKRVKEDDFCSYGERREP